MISMEGVTSELVARNESWVRKQAAQLAHRLPANVERADLIQAGLIAVAQASLSFRWEGVDHGTEAQERFVRYARQRVRGAMLDELRQMDSLGRGDRRQVKLLQIARERWASCNGSMPSLTRLAALTGFEVDAISRLDALVAAQRAGSYAHGDEDGHGHDRDRDQEHGSRERHHPATERDEVEARVDTAIVMRHLERFFAKLPDRDRRIIDSYLGVGLSPVELAASLSVTPSRVSALYKSLVQRLTAHFDYHHHRAIDRVTREAAPPFDALIEARERELRAQSDHWTDVMDDMFAKPDEAFTSSQEDEPGLPGHSDYLAVTAETRWG